MQKVLDSFGQIQQLQLTTLIRDAGKAGNHFADTRAVDIRHVSQIQQQLPISICGEVTNGVTKRTRSLSQRDPSRGVDYGHIPNLASCQLYTHALNLPTFINSLRCDERLNEFLFQAAE